jgi:MFS family permease
MFSGSAKNAVRTCWLIHQDGLLDIFIGLVILGLALDMALDTSYWFISLVLAGYFVALVSGKELVTGPRLDNFEIDPAQRANLLKAMVSIVILLFLGVASGIGLFMLTSSDSAPWMEFIRQYLWLFTAWIAGISLGFMAYFGMGGKHYFAYALVIVVAFTFRQVLNVPVLPYLFFSATLFLISGLILLFYFLTKYPKVTGKPKQR